VDAAVVAAVAVTVVVVVVEVVVSSEFSNESRNWSFGSKVDPATPTVTVSPSCKVFRFSQPRSTTS